MKFFFDWLISDIEKSKKARKKSKLQLFIHKIESVLVSFCKITVLILILFTTSRLFFIPIDELFELFMMRS